MVKGKQQGLIILVLCFCCIVFDIFRLEKYYLKIFPSLNRSSSTTSPSSSPTAIEEASTGAIPALLDPHHHSEKRGSSKLSPVPGRTSNNLSPGLRTIETTSSSSLSGSANDSTPRSKTTTTTVTNPRQKVYVLPPASSDDSGKTSNSSSSSSSTTVSEHKHFILDGIEASAKLELTDDPLDTEAIWILNAGRYSCDLLRKEFDQRLNRASTTMKNKRTSWTIRGGGKIKLQSLVPPLFSDASHQNTNQQWHIGYDNPWSIVIMDWTDKGVLMEDYKSCLEHIYYSFGYSNQHTFVATRTIVQGRHLQRDMASHNSSISSGASVIYGDPIDYAQELSIHIDNNGGNGSKLEKNDGKPAVPLFAGHVQPIRFGVRGDLVDTINRLMEHPSTNAEDIVTRKRTGDAVHFWPMGSGMKWYGQFRSAVSQTMREFALEEISHAAWNITTDEVGSRKKAGRNLVADAYAEALLSYKIVVVAQRDEWEGHYRLMEGLAGGALVMTDPMHPLPCGLVDGTHLIVYKSMAQLKSYLKYYLEHDDERVVIAKNGYEAAMKYHRSWNIMELMVFGDWSKEYCTG